MSEYGRPYAAPHAMDTSMDLGLRKYMLGVYNHMMIAMVISGGVAFAISQNQAAMQLIFTTPLKWVVMFAPLAFSFLFAFKIMSMAPATARTLFYVFAAVMGLSLSWIFAAFTGISIAKTFFVTAASFGGLSLVGYTTKKNLTGMGTFLIMGVWGLLIAGVANIFLKSPAMAFAVNALGVLIFAGLTAYDTQSIKHSYYEVAGDETMAGRVSILGAFRLYMDFLNLFMFLLQFMGGRRD